MVWSLARLLWNALTLGCSREPPEDSQRLLVGTKRVLPVADLVGEVSKRRAEQVDAPLGGFGAHVGRRAEGRAGNRFASAAGRRRTSRRFGTRLNGAGFVPADDLRQAPVNDQRLAIRTKQDVPGLDVTVKYTTAMGIGDRVANVQEARQEAT